MARRAVKKKRHPDPVEFLGGPFDGDTMIPSGRDLVVGGVKWREADPSVPVSPLLPTLGATVRRSTVHHYVLTLDITGTHFYVYRGVELR